MPVCSPKSIEYLAGCFGLFAGSALAACSTHEDISNAVTLTTVAGSDSAEVSMVTAAPARDGNIAIQEEYDAALNLGSKAALELFIARHPDHALSAEARQYLELCFEEADLAPAHCQLGEDR